jgi:uncharacterized protein
MKLDEIETGSDVFIDANILIYHFTGVCDECSHFLDRCERGDLRGLTSINVIPEVLHRLMMVEAVRKKLVRPPNIVKKLNKHPEVIKGLNEYFINTQKIHEIGIHIKPITFETVLKSQIIRAVYGLMVNDSLIIASMQEEGVKLLATNDSGFSEVDEILLCRPEGIDL